MGRAAGVGEMERNKENDRKQMKGYQRMVDVNKLNWSVRKRRKRERERERERKRERERERREREEIRDEVSIER